MQLRVGLQPHGLVQPVLFPFEQAMTLFESRPTRPLYDGVKGLPYSSAVLWSNKYSTVMIGLPMLYIPYCIRKCRPRISDLCRWGMSLEIGRIPPG